MVVVSGAYVVIVWTAKRMSVIFAPATMSVVVHIIYLFVYALKHYKIIDRECCDSLIESIENLRPVAGNFFMHSLPAVLWPRRVLTIVARYAAHSQHSPEA